MELHHAVALAHRGHAGILQGFDARKPIPYTSRNRVSRAADGDVAYPTPTAAKARHATDCYLYKESGVDDNQDDSYAARRAALEEQFRALPPAGSDAYWGCIEEPDPAKQLPLEVLARCLRERVTAGVLPDAHRIFGAIMRHIEVGVGRWAWSIARQARSGMEPERHDELEQECYLKLWEELKGDTRTFLFENFEHTLDLICGHVAHSMMEKAGEWKRRGVHRPKRIPSSEITSIHPEPVGTDDPPLTVQLVSTNAQDELDQAEYADLLQEVENLPPDERKIIYGLFFRGLTQEELARELNVTDRTIRNRLPRILDKLLKRYEGGQEDKNV